MKKVKCFFSVVSKNQITKISLEKIECIEAYGTLSTLCPLMAYFNVDDIYFQDFLFYLLCMLEHVDRRGNDQLCLLSFRFPGIDDHLIEVLQQIINDRKFSVDYTIKRVVDYIYVQRK